MEAKTYGEIAKEIADDMRKKGTIGVFILQWALRDLVGGGEHDIVEIGGKLPHQCPGYKDLQMVDQSIAKRLDILSEKIERTLCK